MATAGCPTQTELGNRENNGRGQLTPEPKTGGPLTWVGLFSTVSMKYAASEAKGELERNVVVS
jgi:hypothetical protein